MPVSLTALIESLLNPQGRFRTLRDLAPLTDACGLPRYRTEQGMTLFDVRLGERPARLVCRTDSAPMAEPSPTPRPFVTTVRLLHREMLLYADDRPQRIDLLVEELPQGWPLADFLRLRPQRDDRRAVRRLLQHLAPMADSLADLPATPRIDSRTLLVTTSDSMPVLTGCGFLAARVDDPPAVALLRLALLIHALLGEPRLFGYLNHLSVQTAAPLWQAVRLQGEFARCAPLTEAAALLTDPTPDPIRARGLLDDLAAQPFAPIPLLAGLLDDTLPDFAATPPPAVIIPTEDRSQHIDFAACDEVCPRADTLIRYRTGNRWGFADRHGRPLGRETFLQAGDFYEGRAAVLTASGWGLLRRDATYAMPPEWEQLEWYGPDNVATAVRDGVWHLFDRCGRQLTAEGCDWMGEPSDGRLLIRRGAKFGFIDCAGRPVTPLHFDEAYSFRHGEASVRIRNRNFRIDTSGKEID